MVAVAGVWLIGCRSMSLVANTRASHAMWAAVPLSTGTAQWPAGADAGGLWLAAAPADAAASSWLLLWLLLTASPVVRFGLRDLLLSLHKPRQALTRVAIYGAGAAGVQLTAALRLANSHSVELFVDDDPALWRRSVNGVSISPPRVLQRRSEGLDQVLLAIPSLTRSRRRQIVDTCRRAASPCCSPSMEEITMCAHRCAAADPGGGAAGA